MSEGSEGGWSGAGQPRWTGRRETCSTQPSEAVRDFLHRTRAVVESASEGQEGQRGQRAEDQHECGGKRSDPGAQYPEQNPGRGKDLRSQHQAARKTMARRQSRHGTSPKIASHRDSARVWSRTESVTQNGRQCCTGACLHERLPAERQSERPNRLRPLRSVSWEQSINSGAGDPQETRLAPAIGSRSAS